MGTLLVILLCLFACLALVVKLTEKHGKPLAPEQQSTLSRIFVVLLLVLLVAQIIYHYSAG